MLRRVVVAAIVVALFDLPCEQRCRRRSGAQSRGMSAMHSVSVRERDGWSERAPIVCDGAGDR